MINTSPTQPYLNAIKRSYQWVLLFGAVAAALAYAIASTYKPVYESHFSYLVSLSEREKPNEYAFDGVYALQATDLFASTLASWIQTPEVIVAAHEAADLPLKTENPGELTRLVRTQKNSPQLVEVTVRSDDADYTRRLVTGLQSAMDANIDRYHDEGIPALVFRVVATQPWQGSVRVAKEVIAGATFVFVVFIGLNIVLLIEAFRNQDEPEEIKRNPKW